jgi:hypothetical protein
MSRVLLEAPFRVDIGALLQDRGAEHDELPQTRGEGRRLRLAGGD